MADEHKPQPYKRPPPQVPTANLNEPSNDRPYKCQCVGSHGVFREGTTFVGTVFLNADDARLLRDKKRVTLIDPSTLPALPDSTEFELLVVKLKKELGLEPYYVPRSQRDEIRSSHESTGGVNFHAPWM